MITARMNGATLVEMTEDQFAAAHARPLPIPAKFAAVGVAATILCVGLFTHMYTSMPDQRRRNGGARGSRPGLCAQDGCLAVVQTKGRAKCAQHRGQRPPKLVPHCVYRCGRCSQCQLAEASLNARASGSWRTKADDIEVFETALRRHRRALESSSDAHAGEIVRILQARYLHHHNQYSPGGAKFDAAMWRRYK